MKNHHKLLYTRRQEKKEKNVGSINEIIMIIKAMTTTVTATMIMIASSETFLNSRQ